MIADLKDSRLQRNPGVSPIPLTAIRGCLSGTNRSFLHSVSRIAWAIGWLFCIGAFIGLARAQENQPNQAEAGITSMESRPEKAGKSLRNEPAQGHRLVRGA